jgi:hypothetical protein
MLKLVFTIVLLGGSLIVLAWALGSVAHQFN